MTLKLEKEIIEFSPYNEQEKLDKSILLNLLKDEKNIFSRENKTCHFTASSWIINEEKTKVLMVYHNIYDSWSWTGGHADKETDLLKVAIMEAKEETGLENIKILLDDIFSIEILTVDGHMKNGKYISSHLHLNITYLLEARETDILFIKEDENSGVCWIDIEESEKISKEEKMKVIYKKLNEKLKKYLRS
ncbi:MAG: NUDIX hydrolase [Cetobacterium sp.]|uniref:NUDIX hydrolase n=1 Tax=Cetobacterium sp. TaxID=2071632 RepID=UPI003F3BFF81